MFPDNELVAVTFHAMTQISKSPCFTPIKPMTPLIHLLGCTADSNQTPSASLASTTSQISNSSNLYVITPSGIGPYLSILWPRPWLKPSSLFGLKIISYLLALPRLSPLHSLFNIVTRMVFLKPYRGITSGLTGFPIKAKGPSVSFFVW